jgi:hypothetical protein
MTFRNKLITGFGAALCILLLIGALSYQRFLQEDSDQKWVAHSQEVLEQPWLLRLNYTTTNAALILNQPNKAQANFNRTLPKLRRSRLTIRNSKPPRRDWPSW